MPNWSRNVPDDPRGPALPIRRTPARRPLIAVVTSKDLIGTYTHYWKGRTMPCETPHCEPCDKGMPYRWHAYMTAWDMETAAHFLFECTAQAAEHFTSYRDAHSSLRGCKFKATRWRSSPNGRVLIVTKPHDLVESPVPAAPDLIAVLSVLWNLAKTELITDQTDQEENMKRLLLDPARRQGNHGAA